MGGSTKSERLEDFHQLAKELIMQTRGAFGRSLEIIGDM